MKKILLMITLLLLPCGVVEAKWFWKKAEDPRPAEEVQAAPFVGKVACKVNRFKIHCEAEGSLCSRRSWHPGGDAKWSWSPKLEHKYPTDGTYKVKVQCHANGKMEEAGVELQIGTVRGVNGQGPWRCKIGEDGNLYCEALEG